MTQAKRGGEYGVNGEWYFGGEFLPSSPNTIKGEFSHQKAQKQQARKDNAKVQEAIDTQLLEWYRNHPKLQAYPMAAKIHARELFAQYLRENGVDTRYINIYGPDLAKWVL